ncbi:MAG: acetylglutamate kinase [Planctomycetaceae bacterium]
MQQAIDKANVLVEAMSWIRQFRDRYIVIKLGGSGLDDEAGVRAVLADVVFMATVGMKPIIVHGGGKAISRAMAKSDIDPRFVSGRRYTDTATLEIVSEVLGGLSDSLVEIVKEHGATARKLHCDDYDLLIGEPLVLKDEAGEDIDLGHVGKVVGVDRDLIASVCSQGVIPIIPCLAVSADGQKFNVNGDTAAAALARFLNVEKLVFLSDVPGILRDPSDPGTLVSHVDATGCRKMIADGTIHTGMVPKVDAALDAVDAGVRKVHLIAANVPHSLLLEVYSDTGIGTEIVRE